MTTYNLNWANDPVVRLEKAISPAFWAPGNVLLWAKGNPKDRRIEGGIGSLKEAETIFRDGGRAFLSGSGVAVDEEGRERGREAADAAAKISAKLGEYVESPADTALLSEIADYAEDEMRPRFEAALDAMRRAYISMVLERQKIHAELFKRSTGELERISKQIFLVAINASVEAERIGEHGGGIKYISSEIRQLSVSARSTIDEMIAQGGPD